MHSPEGTCTTVLNDKTTYLILGVNFCRYRYFWTTTFHSVFRQVHDVLGIVILILDSLSNLGIVLAGHFRGQVGQVDNFCGILHLLFLDLVLDFILARSFPGL